MRGRLKVLTRSRHPALRLPASVLAAWAWTALLTPAAVAATDAECDRAARSDGAYVACYRSTYFDEDKVCGGKLRKAYDACMARKSPAPEKKITPRDTSLRDSLRAKLLAKDKREAPPEVLLTKCESDGPHCWSLVLIDDGSELVCGRGSKGFMIDEKSIEIRGTKFYSYDSCPREIRRDHGDGKRGMMPPFSVARAATDSVVSAPPPRPAPAPPASTITERAPPPKALFDDSFYEEMFTLADPTRRERYYPPPLYRSAVLPPPAPRDRPSDVTGPGLGSGLGSGGGYGPPSPATPPSTVTAPTPSPVRPPVASPSPTPAPSPTPPSAGRPPSPGTPVVTPRPPSGGGPVSPPVYTPSPSAGLPVPTPPPTGDAPAREPPPSDPPRVSGVPVATGPSAPAPGAATDTPGPGGIRLNVQPVGRTGDLSDIRKKLLGKPGS